MLKINGMNYKNNLLPLSRILKNILIITIILLILIFIVVNSSAQTEQQFLSAKESDPIKMGWMQGFPPPEDKRLKMADGSFFKFPRFALECRAYETVYAHS